MATSNSPFQRRYPPEMRERAVRMVREAIAESGEHVGATALPSGYRDTLSHRSHQHEPTKPSVTLGAVDSDSLQALVFDVFGTCVDWRGTVIRACEAVGRAKGLDHIDWAAMADEWRRDGYIRGIARILAGESPYVSSDVLFRRKLDELLPKYGVDGLSEPEIFDLAHAWRRLDPWPDTVPGLLRLKSRYIIATLSNGSFATLTYMARRGGMPWDCIISTELRHTFKPDREAYLLAPALLDLEPDQVMLVAAHDNDLKAAQAAGLHTALVPRPLEWGPDGPQPPPADPSFDFVARDFGDLTSQLGIA